MPPLDFTHAKKTWKRRIVMWGAAPVLNGIAAVSSVLAGALASFFTGSIRSSIGLPALAENGTKFSLINWSISGESVVFWSLVLFAAVLFAWSKFSDSTVDNEHKQYIGQALHGLESMPPDAFLLGLAKEYVDSHSQLSELRALTRPSMTPVSLSVIDKAIREVLLSLARTVESYDGHRNRSYRISLLLFKRKDWDDKKLKSLVDTRFITSTAQLGSLESFSSLSVIYPAESVISLITAATEFAYPVYKAAKDSDEKNLLPGPPRAFHKNGMFECNAVDPRLSQLIEYFTDTNHLEAMRNFYYSGAGKNVKSFLSIAVPANKWERTIDTTDLESSGVIHIEASETNVMKTASGFFWPVAQPYLLLISDMLAIRSAWRPITSPLSPDDKSTKI